MHRAGGASAFAVAILAILAGACGATSPHAKTIAAPSVGAALAPGAGAASGDAANASADDADDDDDDDTDGDPQIESEPSSRASRSLGPCPAGMALVTDGARRFCIDRWEASLVEVLPDGTEKPFPHYLPVDGHDVRAVSVSGVFPQGYISEVQAQDACGASNKRLCRPDEWKTACMGPSRTTFPYGDARRPGVCHDTGKSAVVAVFGAKAVAASMPGPAITERAAKTAKTSSSKKKKSAASKGQRAQASSPSPTVPAAKTAAASTSRKHRSAKKSARPASVDPGVWAKLNDPGLGQVEGALAKTGDHDGCVNAFGVFDMVGNLHEWVATDPAVPRGTFAGGYYLDTAQNGDGCNYRTVAHAHDYHDYSTGFRCCADELESPR